MTDEAQPEEQEKYTPEEFEEKELRPSLYRFAVLVQSSFFLVASNVVVFLVEVAFKRMGTNFPPIISTLVGGMTLITWVVFNLVNFISDLRPMLGSLFKDWQGIVQSVRGNKVK